MTEHELSELFRKLRENSPRQARSAVEAQLIAAFRARHPKRRPVWHHWREVAAMLVLGVALFFARSRMIVSPKPPATVPEVSGFIALPYAQSGVPLEQAVIVRMNVSASTLTSLGMQLSLIPQGNVNAELLVGQDGVARAVRILQ